MLLHHCWMVLVSTMSFTGVLCSYNSGAAVYTTSSPTTIAFSAGKTSTITVTSTSCSKTATACCSSSIQSSSVTITSTSCSTTATACSSGITTSTATVTLSSCPPQLACTSIVYSTTAASTSTCSDSSVGSTVTETYSSYILSTSIPAISQQSYSSPPVYASGPNADTSALQQSYTVQVSTNTWVHVPSSSPYPIDSSEAFYSTQSTLIALGYGSMAPEPSTSSACATVTPACITQSATTAAYTGSYGQPGSTQIGSSTVPYTGAAVRYGVASMVGLILGLLSLDVVFV